MKTQMNLFFIFCLSVFSFGQINEIADKEKRLAVTVIQAQIDTLQKQINTLSAREASARSKKNAADSEANKAKREVAAVEKEYKDALAYLKANPQSQTSRRTVDIAQQHLEEANANYAGKEQQAKNETDLWRAADGKLKKERANIEELRETLVRLNEGLVEPQEILALNSIQIYTDAQSAADTTTVQTTHETDNDKKDVDEVVSEKDTKTDDTFAVYGDLVNVERQTSVGNRYLIFSVRPEFVVGLMDNSVTAIGASVEWGIINNGFYFTGDLSGGALYIGDGVNIGYCFNCDGAIKIALGAAAGLYYTAINVDFTRNGKTLESANGKNMSFVGIFVKLMGGKAKNFDISYKLLLGRNESPVSYKEKDDKVVYDEGFGVRNSVGVGYTVTRKSGRNAR
ncbi:MAG: hypothetical protein LBH98_03460 [Chitinispirillales bacterium]|jgi:hypothetical protein|nr:hypothetical protein [Chitinispirillales bacterium]